jgi:hypothetical protein
MDRKKKISWMSLRELLSNTSPTADADRGVNQAEGSFGPFQTSFSDNLRMISIEYIP